MTTITRAEALKGLLAFSALTTVLAGCAGEGAGTPGAGAAKGKDTVTVDYATYNPLSLVIKKKGWLEKALQEKGKKLEWVKSAGSNKANEALRSGNIDVGSTAGSAALLARVTEAVKAREALGYAYDAADGSFELLLRAALGELPEYFRVESWRASIQARPLPGERLLPLGGDTPTDSEATVRLWVGGRRRAVLGEGNGPVNALDHALCEALAQTYPEIRAFELTDFKVRILDAERGTRSIVRVLIEITDGERSWSTVGVGTDIIEASWEALTDGHVVGLIKAGVAPR